MLCLINLIYLYLQAQPWTEYLSYKMDKNQRQGGENQEENHILKMKCKLYTIWEIQVQLCHEMRTQALRIHHFQTVRASD